MTLKDLRDDLSRKMAADKSLADLELNHVCIEDTQGRFVVDYLLKDDSDVIEDEDDDYEDEDEDDSELEGESWLDVEDSELY